MIDKTITTNARTLINLSRMDFRKRYLGTYLGVIWAVIMPLVTIFLIYFVFAYGLKTPSMGSVPYITWLIPGMLSWFFISECMSLGCSAIIEYPHLVTKIKFPVELLPIVKTLTPLPIHLLLLTLAFFSFSFDINSTPSYWPQIAYYLICGIVLGLGIAYITSASMVFIRDVGNIVGVIISILFWATPIFYDPDILDGTIAYFLIYSPVSYIVIGYRDSFFGGVLFWDKPFETFIFWGIALLLLIIGRIIFQRSKTHFADAI